MIAADGLRPPTPNDPTAAAYKDWLHLNVFDHATGMAGFVNVSLHGSPADERSRAVGAALLHVPDAGWVGGIEIRPMAEATVEAAGIALERTALAVDHASGQVHASVRMPDDLLELDLRARATVAAVAVDTPMRLGHGWISWYAVSRLRSQGEARVDGTRLDLANASAYHDHNWGRWHWGDEVGWHWGAFHASADGPAFVARTSDPSDRHPDPPSLFVYWNGRRRAFVGPSLEIAFEGTGPEPLRRLPGALAALHSDRADPRLPARVRIRADDGVDRVALDFEASAAMQLVTADPVRRGYTFINELAGTFSYSGSLRGAWIEGDGLGMVERAE